MLKISNVSKNYGNRSVIKGINFQIENGLIGLLGANGVGKTTFFKIVNGSIRNFSGNILNCQYICYTHDKNIFKMPDLFIKIYKLCQSFKHSVS